MNAIRALFPASSKLRRHWALAPGTVLLNHGSFGACPRPILALQNSFRRQMEREPVQFLWRYYDERLDAARAIVADFVGVKPADLVFVTNATTGVNAVLASTKFRSGDELLTTDHDYNACRNVLAEHARRAGARLVIARVPFPVGSADQIVEAVLAATTRRTRLAMIDHITSSTALIFPVAKIVQELERRGIDTLIDGAHAPGMVPLNISKLAPAYYTANLHKWVCAPKGAAFLWVRPDKQKEINPAIISHGNNTSRRGHSAYQDRFDWAGTFDPTAWFCTGETIRWMQNLLPGGWPAIRDANHKLAVAARKLLSRQLDLPVACPQSMIGSMATLPLPRSFQGKPKDGKIDSEQSRLYDEYKVEVPFFRVGEPPQRYFRISAHLYNSLPEYEYLAKALQAIGS